MSEVTENNFSNTRWWESYLVRYLSGSIVGAFCIIAILLALVPSLSISLKEIKTVLPNEWKDFPIIGLLVSLLISGLVYSYIISSPITVYHYGRGGSQNIETWSRYMWLGWSWTILISLLPYIHYIFSWFLYSVTLIFLVFLCKSISKSPVESTLYKTICKCIISSLLIIGFIEFCDAYLLKQSTTLNKTLLLFSVPAFFVGIMQYITLFRILHSEDEIHNFYKELIKARATKGAKDVRETYSHLREHSNSTFIVVLEICFTCLIILLIQLSKNLENLHAPLDYNKLLSYGLGFLIFWSIPNVFMWSRANNLEKSFLKDPNSYVINDTDKT